MQPHFFPVAFCNGHSSETSISIQSRCHVTCNQRISIKGRLRQTWFYVYPKEPKSTLMYVVDKEHVSMLISREQESGDRMYQKKQIWSRSWYDGMAFFFSIDETWGCISDSGIVHTDSLISRVNWYTDMFSKTKRNTKQKRRLHRHHHWMLLAGLDDKKGCLAKAASCLSCHGKGWRRIKGLSLPRRCRIKQVVVSLKSLPKNNTDVRQARKIQLVRG